MILSIIMAKTIRKIRVGGGDVWIVGRMDGTRFVPMQYGKYYKRKSSAENAAKK